MIAVDSNILIYAVDRASPFHAAANAIVRGLAEGPLPWALPWPCVYEFLRVTTHPKVFRPPLSTSAAMRFVQDLCMAPGVLLLSETPRHTEVLAQAMAQSGASGNLIFDARIWSLCLEHGISELVSGDRDFARFRGLRVRNPFLAGLA